MKKISVILLIISLLVGIITPLNGFAATTTINVSIDGKLVEFNNSLGYPFTDSSGNIQVPFKAVLEKFGAKVSWNAKTPSAIAEKNGIKVEIPIGKKYLLKNGKMISGNGVVASLKGKTTYVLIEPVIEALGGIVTSENANGIVISSNLKPKEQLSEELQGAVNILKEKVIFDNDISIFTLFAFMNYTGYDDENNKQGYHEVRKMIRDDLEKMNLSLIDNNYYTNKKIKYNYYRDVLARTDGAPNFRISQSLPKYLSELGDLGIHLKEFYEKANIEELFKKYNSLYVKEMNYYSQSIYPILAKTNQFLKIDANKVSKFYFQVNLLDAYWRGSGLGSDYNYKGKILITGPSDEPNLSNFSHEYLHGVITVTNNELRREIEELDFLMERVPQHMKSSGSTYNNWFTIFDESMIRALSDKFIDDEPNEIQGQVKEGFILTEYFHERFKEYGSYEGTLKEFIKLLITDIKTNKAGIVIGDNSLTN